MIRAPKIERCVLYARISVTKEESVSVERQLESGRKYAEARGWQVVGEFVDDGVSATANRPENRIGWRALLATPQFDAVVIWKVDRLARKVLDFLHVDEVLQRRGAGLVAVEDPIDMTSAQGRAFAVMLAVFGEMEAAAISARISAAREHLAHAGRFPGGGVPYGYASAPNPDGAGRILVPDPERQPWLERMVRMALRGEPVNGITRYLTAHEAPLPARSKPNGVWNRQTVDQLLRNPILAGMTARNPGRGRSGSRVDPFAVVRDEGDQPLVDESLAVITLAEFTELQHVLTTRDVPQARKRGERRATSPLLSKVAVCDDCDVYLCRGTNQKKSVLCCPRCRQTLSRELFDPWLIRKLLASRGREPYDGWTVRDAWRTARDDDARHNILVSQLESLRVRRGVVGRRFDKDRVLLRWKPPTEVATEPAPEGAAA